MTDIIPVSAPDGPQTHALVIGVGRYRHLDGGDQPVQGLETMGLGQLSSTVESARAIASWLIGEHRNAAAPLASVQVLLSPDAPIETPAGPIAVDSATMANVRTAFDEWVRRCSADAGNVAILSFAGHGVARETLALLLEDFGKTANNPFAESIDLNNTRQGMRRCQAATQCYWIDSCRSVPAEVLKYIELGATTLIPPTVRGAYKVSAATINASAQDATAYGRPNEPTQFTKALLRSLRGLGAVSSRGSWLVTTQGLYAGVTSEMSRLAAAEMAKPPGSRLPPQESSQTTDVTGEPVLFGLAAAPEVPVKFDWDPDSAGAAGTLLLRAIRDKNRTYRSAKAAGSWVCDVTAGTYLVEAELDPPYKLGPDFDPELVAWPPGRDTIVRAIQ